MQKSQLFTFQETEDRPRTQSTGKSPTLKRYFSGSGPAADEFLAVGLC